MYKKGDIVVFKKATKDGIRNHYEYPESQKKCEEYNFPIAKSLGIKKIPAQDFLGTVQADQTEEGKVLISYIDQYRFEGALYFTTDDIELVKRSEEIVNNYSIY